MCLTVGLVWRLEIALSFQAEHLFCSSLDTKQLWYTSKPFFSVVSAWFLWPFHRPYDTPLYINSLIKTLTGPVIDRASDTNKKIHAACVPSLVLAALLSDEE